VKIRVLGAYGGAMPGCAPCGFLIDDTVLLEAGSACSVLSLEEQQRIRYVVVSHVHLEHVQTLAYLADNVFEPEGRDPVRVVALPEVIEDVRRHFFNDRIWPDFTRLPDPARPVIEYLAAKEGQAVAMGDMEVRAIAVDHTVAGSGFLIASGATAFVFSGDTHHTDRLWAAARGEPRLKAAFIEVSLPDEMADLAARTRHLSPRQFAEEFRKLGRPDLPVYAYHMKPRYQERIRAQLEALGLARLTVLEDGMELTL
jgi:cAMP phosphodiesterase